MPSSMVGAAYGVAARQLGPALGRHQLRPAPVEAALIELAKAAVAPPDPAIGVEAGVPEAHPVAQHLAAGEGASAGLRAALPIVHVVLLEGAGRAEHPRAGQPDRLLDRGRRRLVDVHPGPDLGLFGAARVPDAKRARG